MKLIDNWLLSVDNSPKRGQVAIIVLLVSAVMLTMGLSMAKRAVVETKIDINDELLKKAFNAAESGVDYYLGTGGTGYASPDQVSTADIRATEISVGSTRIDFGEYTPKGGVEFFWLVNHDANGNIGTTYYSGASVSVCGVGFTGSATIDYFYKSGVNFKLRRDLLDFGGGGCRTVATPPSPLLIAVTPVVNGGKFYALGLPGTSFVSQGTDITSIGRAGGAEAGAEATRVEKSIVIRKRYSVPSFLLTGVVAEGSVLSD
ncbi:MAG: hypothetical protein AAB574_02370 [Patescibacteria group bacterium]